MPIFDFREISFDLQPADRVSDETYLALQQVEKEAFDAAIPGLSETELGHLVSMDDPGNYIATRHDPNVLIEQGRMNPNQEYLRPCVAIAYRGSEPIGYAYSADNISGATELDRWAKKQDPFFSKRYRWVRLIAVQPELQGRGIARRLGHLALSHARPGQPATAYTWPEILPRMDQALKELNFKPTNAMQPDLVSPFGESGELREVKQVRYQTRNARGSAAKIACLAAASDSPFNETRLLSDLNRSKTD